MTLQNPVGTSNPHRSMPQVRRRAPWGSGSFQVILVALLALAFNVMASGSAAAQEASPEASPAATPDPSAPQITIEFTELNDSGIEGEAVLYDNGDQTIVELKIEGAGENHPAHIHEGTCEDLQPQSAFDLENVGEDGMSTSVVDAPLTDLIDGDYAIDLHLSPNELGLLVACVDIEGTPEVPGVGGGTPTTETATEPATEAASETPAVTEEATVEPTASATEETTPAADTTTNETGDGTGADTSTEAGTQTEPTSEVTPAPSNVGGDGTQGGLDTTSGKGEPVDPTTDMPATTGSGSSMLYPESPLDAAIWASTVFSIVLAATALLIRHGETHHTGHRRWRRLGL